MPRHNSSHKGEGMRTSQRIRNSSGTILLLVLWFVLILSVLAISLGREVAVDLALTKHSIGRLKADYLAWSGIMYAMNQIQKSSKKDAGSSEDILKKVLLQDGYFQIEYFIDEERKININAISDDNLRVLIELIVFLGFSEETAQMAAASIVDWQDQDGTPTQSPWGAEDNYYMALSKPYHCKNRPFDQIEELLLVKGISEDLFSKLKNFVTVFPKERGTLKVNFNTASEVVLSAMTRSKTGAFTNTSLEDARSLTQKMLAYRSGPDGQEASRDDRSIEMEKLGLNAKEEVLFLSLAQNRAKTSRYFRVQVRGVDGASGTSVLVEAVIKREDLSIVSWRKR